MILIHLLWSIIIFSFFIASVFINFSVHRASLHFTLRVKIRYYNCLLLHCFVSSIIVYFNFRLTLTFIFFLFFNHITTAVFVTFVCTILFLFIFDLTLPSSFFFPFLLPCLLFLFPFHLHFYLLSRIILHHPQLCITHHLFFA